MGPTNGNPDLVMQGMLPAPYNTTYGPMQPTYQGMDAAGYPPGAAPWPGISPFAGPAVNQTIYQNGFWYNRGLQGRRNFYFQVDSIFSHTGQPESTLIGAVGVNPQTAASLTGVSGSSATATGTTGTLGSTQFNQQVFTTGPYRDVTGGAGGGAGGGAAGTGGSIPVFPAQYTGVMPGSLNTAGLRGTWGWDNVDGSGFVMSGFSQWRSTSSWDLVDPYLDLNPNHLNYNPLLHLHAWFGLPLAGADTDNTSSNGLGTANDGALIPYDMGVRIEFATQLSGANADWFFSPIYEGSKIKFRTLAGARYFYLNQQFSFDGYDSGMSYTINASSTGGGGGGTTTTTGQSGAGYLTPSALNAPFNLPNVNHSRLVSSALSSMAGPEIGLRMDLGGQKFQIYTTTKVAALASVTNRSVSGFGIGNAFNITTVNGVANTVPVMPNDPSKTQFNNTQMTTTMCPMFEQSVQGKIPVFGIIPYVNKMELFEQATLNVGYTFLFIGDIYSPQNTIVWNQYPNTPQLSNNKSNYINHMVNIGIEWTY